MRNLLPPDVRGFAKVPGLLKMAVVPGPPEVPEVRTHADVFFLTTP